jgi:hypothetical protein
MSAAIAEAVPPHIDGIALGIATLVFFLGDGTGAAVAGLGRVVGHSWSLLLLAALPLGRSSPCRVRTRHAGDRAAWASRSWFRRILPVWVFGRSSMMCTARGHL